MLVSQRIRAIRLMEKMEKSNICEREDEAIVLKDDKNNVLIEAKIEERS